MQSGIHRYTLHKLRSESLSFAPKSNAANDFAMLDIGIGIRPDKAALPNDSGQASSSSQKRPQPRHNALPFSLPFCRVLQRYLKRHTAKTRRRAEHDWSKGGRARCGGRNPGREGDHRPPRCTLLKPFWGRVLPVIPLPYRLHGAAARRCAARTETPRSHPLHEELQALQVPPKGGELSHGPEFLP
jgi:hypothetical protein